MKITISLEARFYKTPDCKIWSESGPNYLFWKRYLDIFSSVEVVARVQRVGSVPSKFQRADGEGINFIQLPYYVGPFQYLCNSLKIRKIIKATIENSQAIILRTPGQISNCLFNSLRSSQHPYAVEVVGDPYEVFVPGSVDHPLRFIFRWLITRQLKRHCEVASAASYVTENVLQRRYPNQSYTTHYSSIDLGESAYISSPKNQFSDNGVFRLVFVGTLAQLYKAPDVLIDAFSICISKGLKIELKIVGDGKFRPQLEEQVANLSLQGSVQFLGQLSSGSDVRSELLQSDVFVLASHGEGLPRAMIEAMACGLPCVGSNVSGIPELLPVADLVPPGNAQALACKIEEIITNPDRMCAMSARNLEKAKEYRNDILAQRRHDFYDYLRQQTEEWLSEKKA